MLYIGNMWHRKFSEMAVLNQNYFIHFCIKIKIPTLMQYSMLDLFWPIWSF